MSDTATLEPPKQTSPVSSILEGIKKAEAERTKSAPASRGIAEQKKAEKAPEPKEEKPVVPVEEKKPEQVPVQPPPDDKEKNFAALRQAREAAEKAREAAEKERDEIRAKYEEANKNLETYKVRPDPMEVEKERESLRTELKKYQDELKAAAIHRDPEFQQKYDQGIQRKQQAMVSILRASGINEGEAAAAVSQWNKAKFGEFMETLPVLQQGELASLIRGAEDLASERNDAIQNAEKTYEARQKQRQAETEEQQAKFKSSMKSEAESVIQEMISMDGIKDNAELKELIRGSVLRAAPIDAGHMSSREVFRHVASSVSLAFIAQGQQKELEESKAKITELEKKVGEQDEFIKQRYGAIPKPGESSAVQKGEAKDSMLMGIVKRFNSEKAS